MNRKLYSNRMTKTQFFRVFVPAYTQCMIAEAIRKGYKDIGIYSVNLDAEKLKNIQTSVVYDRCKWVLEVLGTITFMFNLLLFQF